MTIKLLEVIHLGRMSYKESLKVQERYAQDLVNSLYKQDDTSWVPLLQKLLLVEHTPVYTVGQRQKNHSNLEIVKLQKTGADFHETNRGGLITYHGPGQLVAYPIIHIKYFKIGLKSYVSKLEKTVINTCQHFGVIANTSPDTGVWVNNDKIAAIGIHASRYVTTHGLALNCNTDLRWFDHIVPCGLEGKGVTSLSKECGHEVTIAETIKPFIESFAKCFECDLQHDMTDNKFR